jgi:hypothetical protein
VKQMRVEELNNAKEWEKFVCSSDAGTFYHSLKWKEVIERSFAHRALYLVARSTDGRLVGVLPGFITQSFCIAIYDSIPYSDYGGPIIDPLYSPHASLAMLGFLRDLSLSRALAYARLRVTSKSLVGLLRSQGVYAESTMGAMEIDLAKTPSKLIWDNVFSSSRRKKFRQMERRGFQVREAHTKSDLRIFYNLYLKNMTYLDAHPYPFSFMEAVWDKLFPSFIRIRILENRKPLAAKLFFRLARKSFSAYVGIDRKRARN